MEKDIAIIGMAGRFPGAANIDELCANLEKARDSVGEISARRLKDTALPLDGEYTVGGYLEDIDKFDYELFRVSLAEARSMDPIQRLLLEIVYETFANAGYSSAAFNNSNTAVFVGDTQSNYYTQAENYEAPGDTQAGNYEEVLARGNLKMFHAARVSRQFNLKGSAVLVDTACSSSLAAVHLACNELILGDADYALVCGVNLYLFPYKDNTLEVGLWSPDGKSRAFSAGANGMSRGEAAAAVLLKPLEKALKDNDIIQAVIKSTAVNNNARRGETATSPDSISQAEVIEKAWKKAGIDPTTLGYIETHGTGTLLGDALEVEGLNMAFRKYTATNHICPISTIKANVGHGMSAAGITGLIRAVLSLKYRKLFPTVHFAEPNPVIDFQHSAVYVNRQLKEWTLKENAPRLAAVTSLGASGINCHAVLEESPPRESPPSAGGPGESPYLIVISSRTPQGLIGNLQQLQAKLRSLPGSGYSLRDIGFTLGQGRVHYEHRFATVVETLAELNNGISLFLHPGDSGGGPRQEPPPGKLKKLIFIFSDSSEMPLQLARDFSLRHPVFRDHFDRCEKLTDDSNPGFYSFAFQYAFYRLLEHHGIFSPFILGLGVGEILQAVIADEISLAEGVARAQVYTARALENPGKRVEALLARERQDGAGIAAFLFMVPGSEFENSLRAHIEHEYPGDFYLFALPGESACEGAGPQRAYLHLLRRLYLDGYELDWAGFCRDGGGQRVELPAYSFARTRCWLRETPLSPGAGRDFAGIAGPGEPGPHRRETHKLSPREGEPQAQHRLSTPYTAPRDKCEQALVQIMAGIFHIENVGVHDNFFELGGDSLKAAALVARAQKDMSVHIPLTVLFATPTVSGWADYVRAASKKEFHSLEKAEKQEYYPLSSAQKRLYLLQRMNPGNTDYNLPQVFYLEEEDGEKLEKAFIRLLERHESLRTSFHMLEDQFIQKVWPGVTFKLEYPGAVAIEAVTRDFIRPFDLARAPLVRAGLVKHRGGPHLLLLDLHHIVTDGLSQGLLIEDFIKLYAGKPLPPLCFHYKDYCRWMTLPRQKQHIRDQEAYWLKTFETGVPVLHLPLDFDISHAEALVGNFLAFEIGAGDSRDLERVLWQEGVRQEGGNTTLTTALLAIYYVLLGKYCHQEDLIIGIASAGRSHADLQNLVGMFVNILPVRVRAAEQNSFSTFLKEVNNLVLKAYENQDYPYEELVKSLNLQRRPGRDPLVDAVFTRHQFDFEVSPRDDAGTGDLKITPHPFENKISNFLLDLEFYEADGIIHLRLRYFADLFRESTIHTIKNHFLEVLQQVVRDIHVPLKDIRISSPLQSGKRGIPWNDNRDFDF